MNGGLAAQTVAPDIALDSQRWALAGGRIAHLRPLRPGDIGAEQAFFNGLSLDSRHQRFHFGLRELSPALLKLLTDVDQRLHRAWVVEADEPGRPVIADARYGFGIQRGRSLFTPTLAQSTHRSQCRPRMCTAWSVPRRRGLGSKAVPMTRASNTILICRSRNGTRARASPLQSAMTPDRSLNQGETDAENSCLRT